MMLEIDIAKPISYALVYASVLGFSMGKTNPTGWLMMLNHDILLIPYF